MQAYSRRGNYHSDPALSAELALPGLVAQGVQAAGPAYGMLLDEWGEEFLAHGEIEMRFVGIVLAGDTDRRERRDRRRRRDVHRDRHDRRAHRGRRPRPPARDAGPMTAAALHPDVAPLEFLLGTWSGPGHGVYPTIEPFDYDETVTFAHIGKPFLDVHAGNPSRRRAPAARGDRVLATPAPRPGRVVLAHPNGLVEVSEGTIDDGTIALRSTTIAGTALGQGGHGRRARFRLRRGGHAAVPRSGWPPSANLSRTTSPPTSAESPDSARWNAARSALEKAADCGEEYARAGRRARGRLLPGNEDRDAAADTCGRDDVGRALLGRGERHRVRVRARGDRRGSA